MNRQLLIMLLILSFTLLGCQPKEQNNVDVQPEKHIDKVVISAKTDDPRKLESMTKISYFEYDFDNDGIEEMLELYTHAERNAKGEMVWDDGQKWLLVLQDGDKFYSLLSEFVQLGQVYFTVSGVYEENKMPTINVYRNTSSNIKLLSYTFDNGKEGFVEEVLYDSKAINGVFTSIPSY